MIKTQSNKLSFFFAILFYSVSCPVRSTSLTSSSASPSPFFHAGAHIFLFSRTLPSQRGIVVIIVVRTLFGWKVARSCLVGCCSHSFSVDLLERLSTDFDSCTLRHVDSHSPIVSSLSGQAQGRGHARPPGRRRQTRVGPMPPRQVCRVLQRLPRHCSPAFVILLALGTRR
jgi:hypothetical protein